MENTVTNTPNVLVELTQESEKLFSAQIVGTPSLRAQGPTREEAIENLTQILHEKIDSGQIVPIPLPQEDPVLKWFGHAKDDPHFDEYLEEIRRFREEEDRREREQMENDSCSDSSSSGGDQGPQNCGNRAGAKLRFGHTKPS